MKANELRINNLVYTPNNFIMKVVGIFDDQVLLDFEGNEGDVFDFKPNELNPIPLIDSMLKECSFEHTKIEDFRFNPNWYTFVMLKKYFVLSVNIMGEIKIETDEESMINFNRHIFFHELQNLYFALTGEELIIKQQEQ